MASAVRTFEYKSRDSAGKMVKGKLDAATEGAVVSKLRVMGLAPIDIKETLAGTGLQREINLGGGKSVGLKDLAIMARQMSTMTGAGLSLLKTLDILAAQTAHKKLATILAAVSRDVESGSSFSQALARHPVDFPPLMISMVRAGEAGGFLDSALDAMAENFEKEANLRASIKSALTYPVMVLIMTVAAVALMLIFIVPIFKTMFEGLGSELPAPTQFLVTLSESMIYIGPAAVVIGIFGSIWWRANRNTEAVRKVVDPIKLRMPVFGGLMKKVAVARFTRNFANMLQAGVPILQALSIVGETSGNWVIEKATRNIADGVRQGKSIAEPLALETVFPPMVVQMIAVGEDSGAMEVMLNKVSDFYEAEVKTSTEALTSLIEPLMIAFLGVVVGGMVIALYMPIFSIATVVK
ncbi:type II secretion system F family protein [Conyzicola nivalis]|uniref:Type II secretion system protein F n=1 Tax=Conyzicola nivalis TaxID=1477021 RepID=A0A916SQG3_9MICO|nr:type II secretion system F family protein [Conyzicola nivalis]GGB11768.1 type II secretion system protein F [Conyzicola nivalis]